jgi:hypothetical protein
VESHPITFCRAKEDVGRVRQVQVEADACDASEKGVEFVHVDSREGCDAERREDFWFDDPVDDLKSLAGAKAGLDQLKSFTLNEGDEVIEVMAEVEVCADQYPEVGYGSSGFRKGTGIPWSMNFPLSREEARLSLWLAASPDLMSAWRAHVTALLRGFRLRPAQRQYF